jgi:biopolymer transport protein TolQ
MIVNAGPMVKLVLIILLFFSIASWSIILQKLKLFRKAEMETRQFYDLFWDKKQFAAISEACNSFKTTPLTRLFLEGYKEFQFIKRGLDNTQDAQRRSAFTEGMGNIERALRRTTLAEINRMEKAVPFLATTGNTTPFIGLFGTVWGLMSSFRSIGLKGTANLAVVGPGISEALITTAMGLVAAIPAVIAYNHLTTKIARITSEMENFSIDFLGVIEKLLEKDMTNGDTNIYEL